MPTHEFILIIEGADVLADEALDALFEAGCGDGGFGVSNQIQEAHFHREADSYEEAVSSAIAAIEGAVPGAHVVRVESPDWRAVS